MTIKLFTTDAYLKSCEATITKVSDTGIVLDQTIFYAQGGGQPGDTGVITLQNSSSLTISNTVYNKDNGDIVHQTAEPLPDTLVGTKVTATIDWDRRYTHMRMHTCLHLLCSLIDAPVTGGSISSAKSRLDFDLPEMNLDKETLSDQLNKLIEQNTSIAIDTISDEELATKPEMIRTMSVKPPSGQGSVRLINIAGVDLQPCGGTHIKQTAEIGSVRISKIEKKGRQNRRVNIVFTE